MLITLKLMILKKFEIDGTIITCLNDRNELFVTDERTDPYYRKAALLKILVTAFSRAIFKLRGRQKKYAICLNK